MGKELLLFVKSVWYGSFLLMIYDCLRILRRVFKHSDIIVAVEDLIFWTGSAMFLFVGYFRDNSGILRGYLFVGTIVGAAAWYFSLSRYFVKYVSMLLIKLKRIFMIPVQKTLILVKRLKFWEVRCKLSLNTRRKAVCRKWKQKAERNRGADYEKKENRRKTEKYKSKAHCHGE